MLLVVAVFLFLWRSSNVKSEREACEFSGGEWTEFNDACANHCAYARGETEVCAQVITNSCACESTECWNGEECVPI